MHEDFVRRYCKILFGFARQGAELASYFQLISDPKLVNWRSIAMTCSERNRFLRRNDLEPTFIRA
ncbi:hypothetical protein [Shimia isoporae]|uniref:hypothetical protein n=1 Tax=Shimia isoporae TaxID=647720 RepID=UPI001404F92D|nr:hypothetical protein [Shimia isoporae]